MTPGALEGIRVLDFGQYLPGPLLAMMLADNGADVVRIDPPGGPSWDHPVNALLQRGKRRIVLDLKQPEDVRTARQLARTADVLIENFRPGVMERLGLCAEQLLAENPRLVFCSLPGFGENDPRAGLAGWEGIIAAATGLYRPELFRHDSGPVFTAVPLASSYAAFIAAHATVAALIARERGGRGQRIEVPLFAAAFQAMGYVGQMGGIPSANTTNMAWFRTYQCGDGRWVALSPPFRGTRWFAERFLPAEEVAAGTTDSLAADPASIARTEELLAEVLRTKPAAEWERIAAGELGCGVAICQTTADWLNDSQALDSRCVLDVDDPELGNTRQAGFGVDLSLTPPAVQSPRHRPDADREAVLADARTAPAPARAESTPQQSPPPLAGIKAVDLTQVLAGPTATRILAEYGAEVIKINDPHPLSPTSASASNYVSVNDGKRTILLDLRQAEGLDILMRLVEDADVFHQNFVPGAAERMGIGEAAIRAHQPEIIYSSISAHAVGGFRGRWRGHEELGQAVTGMKLRAGAGEPKHAGFAVCDYGTGHLSAFGILLALFHRLRTGRGQHVRAALSQTATMLQTPFMLAYDGRVWDEPQGVDARGWSPLCRLYLAGDRWFFLAARPTERSRVLAVAGAGDLPEGDLPAVLERRFAEESAAVWVSRLTDAGIAAHVVNQVGDAMDEQVTRDLGISVRREYPGLGNLRNIASWGRLSGTPTRELFPAYPPGTHTREVVDELGFADQVDALIRRGTLGVPEPAGSGTK